MLQRSQLLSRENCIEMCRFRIDRYGGQIENVISKDGVLELTGFGS